MLISKRTKKLWSRLPYYLKVILVASVGAECASCLFILYGSSSLSGAPLPFTVFLLMASGLIGFGFCALMVQDISRAIDAEELVAKKVCPSCHYELQVPRDAVNSLMCTECGFKAPETTQPIKFGLAPLSGTDRAIYTVLMLLGVGVSVGQPGYLGNMAWGGALAIVIILFGSIYRYIHSRSSARRSDK